MKRPFNVQVRPANAPRDGTWDSVSSFEYKQRSIFKADCLHAIPITPRVDARVVDLRSNSVIYESAGEWKKRTRCPQCSEKLADCRCRQPREKE